VSRIQSRVAALEASTSDGVNNRGTFADLLLSSNAIQAICSGVIPRNKFLRIEGERYAAVLPGTTIHIVMVYILKVSYPKVLHLALALACLHFTPIRRKLLSIIMKTLKRRVRKLHITWRIKPFGPLG